MRLTDGQSDTFLVASPRRRSMQRGKNEIVEVEGEHVFQSPIAGDATVDLLISSCCLTVQTVRVYDQRGDRLAVWEPGEDVLRRPHGIATTPHGEAIVTDTARSTVYMFAVNDGRMLRQFGSKGDQLQQLRLPFYCAYDSARDEILISDNLNYCVKIFDGRVAGKTGCSGGGYLRRIGSGKN